VKKRKLLLVIRDGWGISPDSAAQWDAVKCAKTPHSDDLLARWPSAKISASGLDVGLPDGIMGNSEVGHQNLGAGRIVDQEIVRIDKAFADGSLKNNPVLQRAFENAKNGKKLHLMGLLSDGGVHSMTAHLFGLLKLAKEAAVDRVYIHAFLDGRDTPPGSGMEYVLKCEKACEEIGVGKIATVIGRFWAMDRDLRWERVRRAYQCLVGEEVDARSAKSATDAIQAYYDHPLSESQRGDEFILPTQIVEGSGKFSGNIDVGDSVIFFNFRGDRPREISRAFIVEDFAEFPRKRFLAPHFVTMTDYEKGLCKNVLFPKAPPMKNILGEYVSSLGLKQFRTAETEKYAHVTFFFNDYRETPFDGEERKLIASPKEVSTYDEKPEMSADAVCEAVLEAMHSEKYDLFVVNFANPDMIGHTGNWEAAKEAVQCVDRCIGKLMQSVDALSMTMAIVADHGNVEVMWDKKNNVPHTQHTTNPVHVILYGEGCDQLSLRSGGRLADVAPTILQLMDLSKPKEMTGESLIAH
jgi:2,3-bisphosphoglycerate-independent phosphoglycerate mutase